MSEQHADKRTVATDTLETLGSIIGEAEKRDAIHLAVEPVTASQTLRPGEDVGFVEGGVGICDKPVGIVDPFLKQNVKRGQRFWLVVYPRQITSLRHVWEHPAFPASTETGVGVDRSASEAYLRRFVSSNSDIDSYEDLMYKLRCMVNCGYVSGSDAHGEIPPELWDHFERVTGMKVQKDDRHDYFSCSC